MEDFMAQINSMCYDQMCDFYVERLFYAMTEDEREYFSAEFARKSFLRRIAQSGWNSDMEILNMGKRAEVLELLSLTQKNHVSRGCSPIHIDPHVETAVESPQSPVNPADRGEMSQTQPEEIRFDTPDVEWICTAKFIPVNSVQLMCKTNRDGTSQFALRPVISVRTQPSGSAPSQVLNTCNTCAKVFGSRRGLASHSRVHNRPHNNVTPVWIRRP